MLAKMLSLSFHIFHFLILQWNAVILIADDDSTIISFACFFFIVCIHDTYICIKTWVDFDSVRDLKIFAREIQHKKAVKHHYIHSILCKWTAQQFCCNVFYKDGYTAHLFPSIRFHSHFSQKKLLDGALPAFPFDLDWFDFHIILLILL